MNKELLEDLIYITSERSKIRGDIIEKDYYVCLILKELASKQKEYFAYFKGGTAVYKMLNVMKRFSEDIDLTVKVIKDDSKNSNKNRLKKSALNYKIDGLELIKDKTIDKKGSITSFYKYDSVFNTKDLYKSGEIQIEATSFTVSEPVKTYYIEPLVYKYATEDEKEILKRNFDISGFNIQMIELERIFVDKIFACEFYYIRHNYKDAVKHLYDITILSNNENIVNLLKNKNKLLKLINYKREEERQRIGGIEENKKIKNFEYMKACFNKEFIDSFNNMQGLYVLDLDAIITIEEARKNLMKLLNIFKKLD